METLIFYFVIFLIAVAVFKFIDRIAGVLVILVLGYMVFFRDNSKVQEKTAKAKEYITVPQASDNAKKVSIARQAGRATKRAFLAAEAEIADFLSGTSE